MGSNGIQGVSLTVNLTELVGCWLMNRPRADVDELIAHMLVEKGRGFGAWDIMANLFSDRRVDHTKRIVDETGMPLAAVSTGFAKGIDGRTLCHAESGMRESAKKSIKGCIDYGAEFGAPAKVGSLQGDFTDEVPLSCARDYLRSGLFELAGYAGEKGVALYYEPLRRQESNLNSGRLIEGALELIDGIENLLLVVDSFHLASETSDPAEEIKAAGNKIGLFDLVDSGRWPAGSGPAQLSWPSIAAALKSTGFAGWLSAEADCFPNEETACAATITTYRRHFQ